MFTSFVFMVGTVTILDDAEIIKLVRSKKRAGAEALYDKYSRVLLLAIIRFVPQKDNAEYLLEQTYITVWNSFENYSTKNGKLLAWMMQIARNTAKRFPV